MNFKAILIFFRLALKNDTQEAILRVRSDKDFSERRYDRAVNMFMIEFPMVTLCRGNVDPLVTSHTRKSEQEGNRQN